VLGLTHEQLIGNNSKPNAFSNDLLNNIGLLTGTKPYIRVGGNTQDYALYNGSLKEATNGTYDLSRSSDYPTALSIGPSFFESYETFPDTKFIHALTLPSEATARKVNKFARDCSNRMQSSQQWQIIRMGIRQRAGSLCNFWLKFC
jgi:hypothetical protein